MRHLCSTVYEGDGARKADAEATTRYFDELKLAIATIQ
jgi:hypothetical protein